MTLEPDPLIEPPPVRMAHAYDGVPSYVPPDMDALSEAVSSSSISAWAAMVTVGASAGGMKRKAIAVSAVGLYEPCGAVRIDAASAREGAAHRSA